MSKPILSLDFDGVCHQYTTKWQGPTVIPDPPVEGLYDFLRRATEIFTIQIYSTRSETKEGRMAMQHWFYCNAPVAAGQIAPAYLDLLQFPESKPKAFVGLDDRILTFEGKWPDIEVLRSWKPWNRR